MQRYLLFPKKMFNTSISSRINIIRTAVSIEWPCFDIHVHHRKLAMFWQPLTHWGRVTHICVGKLTIIGSNNGLSPGRRQAIIWTNAGILFIEPLGTNFSEILIVIQIFSFKKMRLKMSSANWRPFCPGLNVLSSPRTADIFSLVRFPHKIFTRDQKIIIHGKPYVILYINGLVQERRNSIANALELSLSCTSPSIYMTSCHWCYSAFNIDISRTTFVNLYDMMTVESSGMGEKVTFMIRSLVLMSLLRIDENVT